MKSNRDRIINYCKTVETHDIEHLQNAIENERYIKDDKITMMNGCPHSYGAYNFVGSCEIEDIGDDVHKGVQQCLECWTRALQ